MRDYASLEFLFQQEFISWNVFLKSFFLINYSLLNYLYTLFFTSISRIR